MNNIDFSIVILNNNQDNLLNCLNTIEKQNYDLNKIEVIIESDDLDNEILEKINNLKINCIIRNQKDLNIAECYNDGIKQHKGQYLNFINSNILMLDNNSLKKIKEYCDNKIILTNVNYFDNENNKNNKYILSSKANKLYDLEKTSGQINMSLPSFFIEESLCSKLSFNKEFNEECKEKFIIDLCEIESKYYNVGETTITTLEALEDNVAQYSYQHNSNWYNESLINWIEYCKSKKHIKIFIQETLLYILFTKYNCNLNDRNKNILQKEEIKKFTTLTRELLKYIDDNLILQYKIDNEYKKINHRFKISRTLKMYFYKLKYETKNDTYVSDNKIYEMKQNKSVPILNLLDEKINVYAINYSDNKLIFDCTLGIKDYLDDEEINIKVLYGDEIVDIKKTEDFNIIKVFGETFYKKYTFQFEINIKNNYKVLKSYITYKNKDYLLNFNFVKVQARLNNSKRGFWQYKDFIIENKNNELIISKNSKSKVFKLEVLFLLSKLKNEKNKIRVIKLSILRILYYLTAPFLKNKHIWITFDKLYKAGDNGEYLYQYCLKNNKNIYYIIKKDSPDYKRLKKHNKKHILVFNSLKTKLYCLHAESIIKTHSGVLGFCGFDGLARTFIRGLFNAEMIEIQHGLTIQDIPQYQSRLVDNIKLYCIASDFEKINISQPIYGYEDKHIKLTGLARYDGLKNNDKKIILIAPTWRRSITSPSLKHGTPRGHNSIFKQSEYYKIYNSLINNKKLIKTAKEYNYKIVYLIHPTLSGQVDDFDKNEYVEIIPATGEVSYEKILTEASIMVTDYSGIQYDFAYMRKPIVYFHPDELPPHYENGSMNYEKNGFGPIVKTVDELVDNLCDNMPNSYKNNDKYIERSNIFFEYNDYNNCERIMEEIDKYLKELIK